MCFLIQKNPMVEKMTSVLVTPFFNATHSARLLKRNYPQDSQAHRYLQNFSLTSQSKAYRESASCPLINSPVSLKWCFNKWLIIVNQQSTDTIYTEFFHLSVVLAWKWNGPLWSCESLYEVDR